MKFSYVAITGDKKVVRGVHKSETLLTAEEDLLKQFVQIVHLEKKGFNFLSKEINIGHISDVDRLFFLKHLGIMLKAGIPIFEALNMLKEQSKGKLHSVLKKIVLDVSAGTTLAEAMARHPKDFPELIVHLIESGEISGTLESNLAYIANFMQKEVVLKKKVKGALLYPAIVFIAVLAVMMGIGIFVLPQILPLFGSLDVALPKSTQLLIWMANLFKDYGVLLIICIFTVIFLTPIFLELKWVRPFSHRMYLRLPIAGNLVRELNLSRFFSVFATLLRAGITIDRALTITAKILGNHRYRASILKMKRSVDHGGSMTDAVKNNQFLFPMIVVHMIKVGEKSGNLEESAQYLGNYYEEELDEKLKNLSTLLEPILLLVIGLVVAWVALSIIGPIYSLSSGVR